MLAFFTHFLVNKARIITLITILVLLALSGLVWWHLKPHDARQPVTINHTVFYSNIARTPAQQARGLGGVTHLAANDGLYFPLNATQPAPAFWMKDMRIPIDIIWIAHGRVVGITVNAPVPAPHTPDEQLPRFTAPNLTVDGVLEVAANRTREAGINIGDPVKLPTWP